MAHLLLPCSSQHPLIFPTDHDPGSHEGQGITSVIEQYADGHGVASVKRLTLGKRTLLPRMGGSALDPSHFDDFKNNTQPWIQGVRENKGVGYALIF